MASSLPLALCSLCTQSICSALCGALPCHSPPLPLAHHQPGADSPANTHRVGGGKGRKGGTQMLRDWGVKAAEISAEGLGGSCLPPTPWPKEGDLCLQGQRGPFFGRGGDSKQIRTTIITQAFCAQDCQVLHCWEGSFLPLPPPQESPTASCGSSCILPPTADFVYLAFCR